MGQGRAQRSALAQKFGGSASSVRGPASPHRAENGNALSDALKVRGAEVEPTSNAASEEES